MDRLTHKQIWNAIDRLAEQTGHSASGLAKKAGLDPTTFNKSKRYTGEGRERWPSTESIAKILQSTQTSVQGFMGMLAELNSEPAISAISYETSIENERGENRRNTETYGVPLIGSAQAGSGGYFDDGGFPAGQGWDEIHPPDRVGEHSYALKVSGDSMMPLYREGDIIIVDPAVSIHRGDRVVVKTQDGEVFAKTLDKQTAVNVHLVSVNPAHPDVVLEQSQIDWIARIVWASQ